MSRRWRRRRKRHRRRRQRRSRRAINNSTTTTGSSPSSCAPDEITYRRESFPDKDSAGGASAEVPESADVTINPNEGVYDVEFAWGGHVTYEPSIQRDTTIQDYVESGQFVDQVETTDRFDFEVAGTRSWTWEWDEGEEFPTNLDIYVPMEADVLVVWITRLSTGCRDASLPAYERLAGSIRPS